MAVDHSITSGDLLLDLSGNRARLRRELELTLRRYEERYELRSQQLQAALSTGRLRETADVAKWVIAYETYVTITAQSHDQPA